MAALITPKTAYEASTDVVVTTTPVTISFNYDPAVVVTPTRLQAMIDRKDSSGNYKLDQILTGADLSIVINGAGTYRVRKPATAQAVGIDTD